MNRYVVVYINMCTRCSKKSIFKMTGRQTNSKLHRNKEVGLKVNYLLTQRLITHEKIYITKFPWIKSNAIIRVC